MFIFFLTIFKIHLKLSFRFLSRTIQLDFQKGRHVPPSVKEAIFNKKQTQSSQVLLKNEESAGPRAFVSHT